ncbi:glycosyltransferase family 39 protein [Simiduia curdlanivorans]|uniref:Glycosyltransferase family 39 protein n=1 Tax=Simiduia curdlanivorans TaxID=1492769 RepID=A0ABV8V027_9GAMM|nr:glycosyltransferase family 39 protein [Simiduia curdlanivorans]MDN3637872.1 glycosyltransferase family 39 protein [Simiduia curdlanivorans]
MPTITKKTHQILLGFSLLHLLMAATLPLMFFEAHYALYGYYLQLSYVDHPPLMGWLQGVVQIFSSSELSLRLVPILLTLATQYTLVAIALRLYPKSTHIDVALAWLLQLLPISYIVFMAAPDLPLALFSCLAFLFLLKIIERDSWAAWLGLGVYLGAAGLSKYTAITLVISLPIALWLGGRGGRWLLSPKLWVAGAIAMLLVSPVLVWNLDNNWLSFRFQTAYQGGDGSWSTMALASALAAQLATYSPFFLLLFIGARQLDAHQKKSLGLALAWALPTFLLFFLQAGSGRSSPHWTYASWLALTPALAFCVLQLWPMTKKLRLAIYAWASLLAVTALLVIALPWVSLDDYKHPLKRQIGWDKAAKHGLTLQQAWVTELQSKGENTHLPTLMVYNWHYAEPLAWYARPEPVRDIRGKTSQFDQWFGTWAPGDRGILIQPTRHIEPPNVKLEQGACQPIDHITTTIAGNKAQVFHFYRCIWPTQS